MRKLPHCIRVFLLSLGFINACVSPSTGTHSHFKGEVVSLSKAGASRPQKAEFALPLTHPESTLKSAKVSYEKSAPLIFQDDVQIETYGVSGRTIKAISSDLDSSLSKPSRLKANLRSQSLPELRYFYVLGCGKGSDICTNETVSTCKITDIQVWSSARLVLPEHNNPGSLCPYASDVWARFEKNVKEYELGHVANLRQSALDLGRGLASLTSDKKFKRCSQIETAIADLYDIHWAKLNFKNIEYDIQTDHGELSGACFGPHCDGYSKTEDAECGKTKAMLK